MSNRLKDRRKRYALLNFKGRDAFAQRTHIKTGRSD